MPLNYSYPPRRSLSIIFSIVANTSQSACPLALDPVVQEDLKYQLELNLEDIGDQYALYTSSIYESIEEKNVSVKILRVYLLSLTALDCNKVVEDEQQFNLLSSVKDGLLQADTIEKIFLVLIEYSSFLNYHIFKKIQVKFCIKALDYPESLKAYINKHKVSEFVTVNPKLLKLTGDASEIILKFDIPVVSKIVKVLDLKRSIAKILGLEPSTLRLLSIKEGCVEATFLIPSDVAEYIFSKKLTPWQIEQFQALPVTWLKCDDCQIFDSSGATEDDCTIFKASGNF